MGMDILFSTKTLRWDGTEIPMRTVNSNLIDLNKLNRKYNEYLDIFAIASSTMKILGAKYEKANLDAYLDHPKTDLTKLNNLYSPPRDLGMCKKLSK
jgi:hypothetical protein